MQHFSLVRFFFNRYSYADKIRLMCFLGTAAGLFFIFTIMWIQHPIVTIYEKKCQGLKNHEKLISILQKSFNIELFQLGEQVLGNDGAEKSLAQIAYIEKSLRRIKRILEKDIYINKFFDNQNNRELFLVFERVKQKLEVLQKDYITRKNLSFDVIASFNQQMIDLIFFNSRINNLDLGLEMQTFLMTDIAVRLLPRNQGLIINLAAERVSKKTANAVKLPNEQEYLDVLTTTINSIEEEAFLAFNQGFTSSLIKLNLMNHILYDFKEYYKNVFAYLDLLPTSDLQAIVIESEKVLNQGWRLENDIREVLKKEIQDRLATLYRRQYLSTLVIFLGLFSFFLMYITRVIRRPLEELKKGAQELANGNLSVRVPITSKDEVAKIIAAFNHMASHWENSIIQAKAITALLVKNATKIFDLAKFLEENVKNQEKAIYNITLEAKEIAQNVQTFAGVLKDVNKSIGVTSSLVGFSRSNLTEMEHVLHQMVESSKHMVSNLVLIRQQIDKINGIIVTIVGVADQSNLLSLNTAIRASKTGAKGVGFTVVADKIRELADQTAYTTLDIEQTVRDIVSVVSGSVAAVDSFSSEVLNQVDEGREVKEELSRRMTQTQSQVDVFDKIYIDIEEQFAESLKIDKLIANLNKVTSETGSSVRKLYHDAEFLYKGTKDLNEVIDIFQCHK